MVQDERIVHLAKALEAGCCAGEADDPLYAQSIGRAIAVRLVGTSKMDAAARRGLSPSQLQRLFDFIEARLDQPLTIEALSREAGSSSSHLRRWFKVATGTTLHRYVIRRRVERSWLMLLERSLPASEIALNCGFAHQSHLALWMRRELGFTPRDLVSRS
ncbi:AraC family transcriptional regulator (plasmid) [Rhizobium sp. RCAM05350]|nr:AraC family transcriptional regulator [Rhizobium sp. RCAM05350]